MRFQAGVTGVAVERPAVLEVTALGAALLAGRAVGFFDEGVAASAGSGAVTVFEPSWSEDRRETLYAGWKRAVERSRGWAQD